MARVEDSRRRLVSGPSNVAWPLPHAPDALIRLARWLRAHAQPLAIALVIALLGVAYHRLWIAALIELGATNFEAWLFVPGVVVHLPALGLAGWLLARRRERFLRLPAASSGVAATALAVLGIACLALAQRGASTDLLIGSLFFVLLAFAAGSRGAAGVRLLLAPALVLLLGLRLPAALASEILWQLQLWTTRDAAALSNFFGQEVFAAGVMLWRDRVTFQVIESCSGFQTARTLLFLAIILCEVLGPSRRLLVLPLVAPLLGYGVNAARAAVIVSTDPTSAAAGWVMDHTLQGAAVLFAGAGLLFLLGRMLAPHRAARTEPEHESVARNESAVRRPLRVALGLAIATAAGTVVAGAPAGGVSAGRAPALAAAGSDWTSERLSAVGPESFFFGALPWEQVIYRRYALREADVAPVEVFVAPDAHDQTGSDRFFTSRLPMPGPGWATLQRRSVRLWALDVDAEESVVSNGPWVDARMLVYSWHVRDRGVWRESWRDLAAEASRADRPRVAVRVATPLRGAGPFAYAQAKKTLDRFVYAFRDDLAAL
jgi:exosortase/archaeosortase family protein